MAGTLKNCPRCGKLFMDMGHKICPACIEAEQADEDKAADYVREHPKATVKEIARETGVKESLVMRMVRQGRFVSASGIEISYPCEHCGKPITNGRLCDSCNRALITEVKVQQAQKERIMAIRKESAPKAKAPAATAAKKKPAASAARGAGMYSKDMGR